MNGDIREQRTPNSESIREQAPNIQHRTPNDPGRGQTVGCRFFPYLKTRSLPVLARSYPRHFTFYLAHPIRSIPGFLIHLFC
jgi:hypothetical protein